MKSCKSSTFRSQADCTQVVFLSVEIPYSLIQTQKILLRWKVICFSCKADCTLIIFGIFRVFSRNVPWNKKHALYIFCISFRYHVSLMLQKNKPWHPLMFCDNATHGAKCEKNDTKYPAIHFSHFASISWYFAINV